MTKRKPTGLTYVGDGRFLPGVPADDLTEADIERLGLDPQQLVASGLYKEAPKQPETPAKSED